MSRPRSLRPALLIAALGLATAACTSTTNTAPTTPTTTPVTTAPTTTTLPPATTTTELVTTTTIAPDPVFPLTGIVIDDQVAALRPALVVKIDNAPGARPQTGFNAADIVFEEIVNDNLTRFAMVFQSRGSDPVGPIRSGRLQDIDLFGMLNRPLFAWSGGNRTVTEAVRASDFVDLGANHTPGYYRSRDRGAPHDLYANTTSLWEQTPFGFGPPPQQFAYRANGAPAQGEPFVGVAVKLDAIDVRWDWDPATGKYLRMMEGRAHNDGAGGQVTTDNVVVLAMEYIPGISDSPDAQTIGTGEALVFTGGNYVHGTWSRVDRLDPFTLTADDGSIIQLTPGRTFIELPRRDSTLPIPAG